MRITVLAGLVALALPGCLVGTGDITSGPAGGDDTTNPNPDPNPNPNPDPTPTPTPHVSATVDKPTVDTELATTETLTYTITGTDGFAGDVTVTPSVVDEQGAPVTGWTLTPDPATVTLAENGTATVTLAVMIPSDNQALTPTVKLGLSSSADASEVTSAFTIKNQVTITIDAGTGTGSPHTNLPQPNSRLTIHQGTKLIFHNADGIAHRIHGDGGIPHEQGDLGTGTDYVVTPTSSADWYCHDHEGGGQARIVQVVP